MIKAVLRKMGSIPIEERKEILLELQTHDCTWVRIRHGIDNNTLQHIKYYHGNREKGLSDRYHRDLVEGKLSPLAIKIKSYKEQGYSSGTVAMMLEIKLERLNRIWPTV
jgi:hypothetical protein